jgi:2,3-bisphosphoglycerate-independent phosphoglycerate mutase
MFSTDPFVRGLAAHCGVPFDLLPDPYQKGEPFSMEGIMEALEKQQEVILWIPAPFSSERFQEPQEKVRRLDQMDYRLLSPIRKMLQERGQVRFLLAAAGVRHRGRPERGSAPFVLWQQGLRADAASGWTEADAMEGSLGAPRWAALLETFRKQS